jgi:hypothetical protein
MEWVQYRVWRETDPCLEAVQIELPYWESSFLIRKQVGVLVSHVILWLCSAASGRAV